MSVPLVSGEMFLSSLSPSSFGAGALFFRNLTPIFSMFLEVINGFPRSCAQGHAIV